MESPRALYWIWYCYSVY